MIELGLVIGIFLLIAGLMWGIIVVVRNAAETKVDAKIQKERASVWKILSNRQRTKSMAEARRNAARRRDESGE